MNTTLIARRSASVALATALASFASLSHADPHSVTAFCQLTSLVPSKGQCMMTVTLMDGMAPPALVRKAQVKVNGLVVTQSNNDSANPSPAFAVASYVQVACGATHTVTAHIARQGSTQYEQVGVVPPVACPAAP